MGREIGEFKVEKSVEAAYQMSREGARIGRLFGIGDAK
jgi:hypothetical protein